MLKEITQQLPIKLKLLLCYRGIYTLVAIGALIIGGIFSSIQLSDFDFREFYKLNGNTATVKGIITDYYYTGISESVGDDGDYYDIYAYEYEYKVKNEDHKWISYSRNSTYKTGYKVSISYNINSPQYSVIKGFRYRANGISVLFLLVIPIAAIFFLLFNIFKGLKFLKIINNGIITKGKLIHKSIVSDGDNGTYYKLNFVYYSDENKKKRHEISIKPADTKLFEDENKETIIFHKNNPNQSLLLDDMASPVSKYIKKNWLK